MLAELLLPDPTSLTLNEVVIEEDVVILSVSSLVSAPRCPDCHQPSGREHSYYWRTIADLPCAHRQIEMHLLVRRMFCDNVACMRKTFAERFPGTVAPFARRTNRLANRQRQVGFVLGGEAGSRILARTAMPTSGDTVLRLVRDAAEWSCPTPRVLGVDDWAWAKGQRYGTILVDLERHRPVDLLPDRTAETLAVWLEEHPGVEIVSRDRAPGYIDGICRGAPDAIQVADRWHLLRNLKDTLIRVLEQNRGCLYAAANVPDNQFQQNPAKKAPQDEEKRDQPLTKVEQRREATRQRRLARYRRVMKLHQEGMTERGIAHEVGISRRTVHRYITAGGFPEMSERRKGASLLDPYMSHLRKRWAEGCHDGAQLYREIHKQGYPGSQSLVRRWAGQMRKEEPTIEAGITSQEPRRKRVRPWSARYAVWLFLKEPEALSPKRRAALERMLRTSASVRRAYSFAQAFCRIVRHRLSKAVDPWLKAVVQYKVAGLSSLGRSFEKDHDAILAALSLPWSNGQVEGQVNRLKLIKRQMYGRANFDLLRVCVLAPSGP